jgi:peptidoglycan/LPS O-acetylase OafA/YrhL
MPNAVECNKKSCEMPTYTIGITMKNNPAPTRLTELDALRGVAVVLVMLFHYTWQGVHVLPQIKLIPWGLSWGHYGVELFFAISGFVIFMTLERTRNATDFVVSRFARLFPAYWLAIALTTFGVTALGSPSLALPPNIVLLNLTMLQGFFFQPSVDGVYWSLTVELGFYASMFALWRMGWLSRIELVLLGWIALKLLWWFVPELPSRVASLLVVKYIPWFAIGMAMYRIYTGARRWAQQVPVLLLALVVTTTVNGPEDGVVFLAITVIFAALIAGRMSFMNHASLLWLGGISYSFYLIHQNLGYAFMVMLERSGIPVPAALPITIAAALGAAHCLNVSAEKPALAMIRNWWKKHQAPATA